jgi:hypothetical protein
MNAKTEELTLVVERDTLMKALQSNYDLVRLSSQSTVPAGRMMEVVELNSLGVGRSSTVRITLSRRVEPVKTEQPKKDGE